MKKPFYYLLVAGMLVFGCGESTATEQADDTAQEPATETAQQPETQDPGYENIGLEAFVAKMQDPNVVILDVRTPEETAAGMIQGAQEVNVNDRAAFGSYIENLDKDKTYLVYCRSGRRSVKACEMMAERGFTSLYNLEGGYLAWEAAKQE